MDPLDTPTAAVILNAEGLAKWAANAVVETDALIERASVRPLSPAEQVANLRMQRELLVRLSQQNTLLGYALESRPARAPWWARWLLRMK